MTIENQSILDLAVQHRRGAADSAARSLIGAKLRERRKLLGLRQTDLAAQLGISASYLNLIEANKRSIGGSLLKRLAERLGLVLDELDGAAERRLVRDLRELAGEPLLAELQLEQASAEALAGQHTDWGRALVTLHRAWLDGNRAVSALSDRLNQDPFLGDAVHSMLSRVAAIRSSAEILDTVDDLTPEQRQRFVSIVDSESARLSDVAQALAAFFDKAHTSTRSITPVDEVDDFIFEHDNHFPRLEEAAADFRVAAALDDACSEAAILEHLQRIHGVQPRVRAAREMAPAAIRQPVWFDAATRELSIADSVTPSTRRFQLLRLAVELFHHGQAVAEPVQDSPLLTSDAARRRAQSALSSYMAAAVLMPYERVHAAAVETRYDIDHLARRFGASLEQVCHRLVTLRRPGAQGIPFGMMRVDPAGFVTKRFPLPHLLLPAHGNACPLWAVYQAFQSPGAIVRQLVDFPSGDRYLFLARTIEKQRPGFAMPRRLMSLMLACDALHADKMVYAQGLDLSPTAPATPVGANCRLCTRTDCAYREEDPIIDA